ncbi:MAG TPA: SUMF1/EgtB/PvdO family nonheme iron enzyme [Candidatus Dojkabacteria bacterium]|nr:SUMF1/EgtB/PvdO family nonheme iron enzyme [Candidatus Dojkabacteria bacterium]
MLDHSTLQYEQLLSDVTQTLSEKERALFDLPRRLMGPESVNEIREILTNMGFVRFEGGPVLMGINDGLPCSIEGTRLNETPARELYVPPFYVSKYTVSNLEYEQFDKRHSRTNTSSGDKNPVTCVTYGKAVGYAL